jgi:hypothetical protein
MNEHDKNFVENNSGANDPNCFQQLEAERQAVLVGWIREVLARARRTFSRSSYGMKHDFEREPEGFYVTNGMFKGAMLAAGHAPVDKSELNWLFKVKPADKLGRWEKDKMGLVGRGWLIRNRWRDKVYMVADRTQRFRMLAHSRACRLERLPKVLVTRRMTFATVALDTEPAGCRLTREGVAATLELFTRLDPLLKYTYVIDDQLAVIHRVPIACAEELAAALVEIARTCSTAPPKHSQEV